MTDTLIDQDARSAHLRSLLVNVPANHYGVRLRFQRRISGVLSEGLHLKIPFIDEIIVISMHVTSLELICSFTAADQRIVRLAYTVQYRPDPTITVTDGPNVGTDVFAFVPEDEIPKIISSVFSSQLGLIGSHYSSSTCFKAREPLQTLLSSAAKLRAIPHEQHSARSCGLVNCGHRDGSIPIEELLSFYREHRSVLWGRLRSTEERSDLEIQCGISILTVLVTNVEVHSTD